MILSVNNYTALERIEIDLCAPFCYKGATAETNKIVEERNSAGSMCGNCRKKEQSHRMLKKCYKIERK